MVGGCRAGRNAHAPSTRGPNPRTTAKRRVACVDAATLCKFIDSNSHRIAHDVVVAPAFLVTHPAELEVSAERYPQVKFHALREHAGQVFQARM